MIPKTFDDLEAYSKIWVAGDCGEWHTTKGKCNNTIIQHFTMIKSG